MDSSPDPLVVIAGDHDELSIDPRPLRDRALEAHASDQAEFITSTAVALEQAHQRRVDIVKALIEERLGEIAVMVNERVPVAEVDGLLFGLTAYDDSLMLLRGGCGCTFNQAITDLTHLGRTLASHALICRIETSR